MNKIKKIIFVGGILLLLPSILIAQESIPEMSNGNFERGENNMPRYWKTYGDAIFSWDDKISLSPTHSAAIELKEDNHQGAYWELFVDVDPNSAYRLNGAIKAENLDGNASVIFTFLDDKGKTVSSEISMLQVTGTTVWKAAEAEMETPSGARIVRIHCTVKGKGKAWFDNVSCRPAAMMPTY